MSPPRTESAAFENSTTSREATPTAVETRSEFRYRIEAVAPQLTFEADDRGQSSPPHPWRGSAGGLGERARLGCTSTRPRGLS
jgi:hypothetical protein